MTRPPGEMAVPDDDRIPEPWEHRPEPVNLQGFGCLFAVLAIAGLCLAVAVVAWWWRG